jgi:hypothetical protein
MGRQSSRKAWRRLERERFLTQATPDVRKLQGAGMQVKVRQNHGPKMSQVLLDFIRPILRGDETLEEYKAAVALGAIAGCRSGAALR